MKSLLGVLWMDAACRRYRNDRCSGRCSDGAPGRPGSLLRERPPMKAEKLIILLGDSIIDNGAYVCSGEPDVAQ